MPISRDERILKYIEDNPGCTRTKVINHINPSSPGPTERALKRLIEREKKVFYEIDKSNKQIHHLFINDNNAFNQISKKLVDIEKVINKMDKPVEKLFLQRVEWTEKSKTEEAARGVQALWALQSEIETKYRLGYRLMLELLWDRTNTLIHLEKDKQTVYTKIIHLLVKISYQFWNYRRLDQIFKFLPFSAEVLNLSLSKKVGITKELIDQLNITQADFTKGFLP